MSCPVPKKPVDVLSSTVYPLGHGSEAEHLADALDAESRALVLLREELAEVTRERDEAAAAPRRRRWAGRSASWVARQQWSPSDAERSAQRNTTPC
jgi:hypothetical protein